MSLSVNFATVGLNHKQVQEIKFPKIENQSNNVNATNTLNTKNTIHIRKMLANVSTINAWASAC